MFRYFIKNILFLVFCLDISSYCFSQTLLFDDGWKFFKGGAQGGQNIDFNDSAWRVKQAAGKIIVKATSGGLKTAEVEIESKALY